MLKGKDELKICSVLTPISGTCVCTCWEVSPVNIGFAEDGFQAVVETQREGLYWEEKQGIRGGPVPSPSPPTPHSCQD